MDFGTTGEAVTELQRRLIALGYDLGPWGADGALGDTTWDALHDYARDNGLPWRPSVPAQVLSSLSRPPPPTPACTIPTVDPLADVPVMDVRHHLEEPQAKARVRAGRTVMRPPSTVTGITLHQAGVEYTAGPGMLRQAGGDPDLAKALRVQRAACHLMALEDGSVVWTRPLRSYVYHGNLLNRSTIGIEVEGNYAGHAGDPDTAWSGSPYSGPVSDRTIRAARKALHVAVVEGRRLGMPVKYIYAHRQSNGFRPHDPGEELWRAVALEYGVKELGLVTQPDKTFVAPRGGRGRPIPAEWDPQGSSGRY